MLALTELFRVLSDRGVQPEQGWRRQLHIRRSNQMGLIFCLGTLPYALVFPLMGEFAAGWAVLGAALAYMSPLLLNPHAMWFSARALPLLAATTVVLLLSYLLGRECDVHLCLFMVGCWPFNLFDLRTELKSLALLCVIPMVAFLAVQLLWPASLHYSDMHPSWVWALRAMISVMAFLTFVLTLSYFYRRNQGNENTLERHASELAREVQRRRATQVALEQARVVAEEASAAKSRFLATMSHELRTPLNGIVGAANLLRMQVTDRGRSEVELREDDLLDTLQSSGNYLTHMIDNLFDLANIDLHGVSLSSEPFGVAALCEDTVAALSVAARDKSLELDLELQPEADFVALGDEARLRQVLSNLVSNAIRFTATGWVYVRVQGKSATAGRQLVVEVSDTGPGVAEEHKAHIFGMFSQLAGLMNRGQEGVGMGLYLCQRVVDAMGGTLSVSDREGGGSVFAFQVTLPVAEKTLAVAEGRAMSEAANKGVCLLVDNERVHASATALVQRLGYHLVEEPGAAAFVISQRARSACEVPACHISGAGREGDLSRPLRMLPLRNVLKLDPEVQRESRVSGRTGPKRRVLVAEDNPVNRRIITRLLQRMGAAVDEVTDGKAAVEAFERSEYDLILMDIQMPVMDGLSAIEKIRELEQGRLHKERQPVPIAVVTANVAADQRERAQAVGVCDYFTKPYRPERLAEVLAGLGEPSLPDAAEGVRDEIG